MKTKFRKGISMLLAFAVVLTTAVLPVLADDNNGSGVVYEIHNAEELANLGGLDIVGDIELLADIDMANVEMQPIASFQGNLNGNGLYHIKFVGYSGAERCACVERPLSRGRIDSGI